MRLARATKRRATPLSSEGLFDGPVSTGFRHSQPRGAAHAHPTRLQPLHQITSTQLSDVIGLAGYAEANLRYGKLGHAVADELGYEPPKRSSGDRKPRWWMALSTGKQGAEGDGHFEFTMRPELVQAIEAMHWVRPVS